MKTLPYDNSFLKRLPLLTFCLLTYLILPLLFTKMAVDPILTVRSLLSLLTISITYFYLLFSWKHLNLSTLKNPLMLFIFLFTLTSLISGFAALNKAEYFYSFSKDLTNILFYIALVLLIKGDVSNINIIIKTIIISTNIFTFIGLAQFFFGWFNSIPGYDTVYSTFANRNLFASICFLTFPLILYGYFSLDKFWRILSFTAIVQISFIIPAIKARAVFVGVFLVCYSVILIYTFLKLKIPERALNSARILLLVVIFTSLISTGISKMEFVSTKHPKISHKKIDTSSSIFVRIYAWKKTWAMIQNQPFRGVGAGNWKIILPSYGLEGKQLESGAYQYIRPHNDYLWVLAENGIMGFLAYLLIFITAIIQTIRLLRTSEPNKFLIILLSAGVVGYMIIAFFSFPKERVYHSLLLLTYLAIITSISAKKQIKDHPKTSVLNSMYVKSALVIFAFFLSLLLLTYTIKRMKSEIHFYFAYHARLRNQPNLTIAAINEIDPNIFNISPTGIPVQWYRGNAYFQNGRIQRALRDFSEAAETHPYHFYVLNNLGTCYEMNGNHQKAISYYNKVLEISPFYCETLLNLSAVYYNQHKYLKALKTISRCSSAEDNAKYTSYYNTILHKLYAQETE